MILREMEPIAGTYQRDQLLDEWRSSERTVEAQDALLSPYKTRLIVVNMDGGRYSEQTRTLPLFEVLHYVDQLKRKLLTVGQAIGGTPRGQIWEADNGSMLFHPKVSADQVLWKMIELMGDNKEYPMKLALTLGLVNGYKVGNEIYGDEVRELDDIGENVTPGGALYVTPAFVATVNDPELMYLLSPPLDGSCYQPVDLDNVIVGIPSLEATANHYPLPFSPAFANFLNDYSRHTPERIMKIK